MRICKYPGCGGQVENTSPLEILASRHCLCASCYNKILHYEKGLDTWLGNHYPSLFLEDVLGWYAICVNDPCKRDCLETTYPEIIGCNCCPHLQRLSYHRYRIDNNQMPTDEWLHHNTFVLADEDS